VALIPLAALLFGTDLRSKLLLVVYASFWRVLIQVLYGVQDVDPVAMDTAHSYRLGRWARIRVAGIGTTMKVLVIVSGCRWPILLNTVEGCGAATSCWRTPAAPTSSAAPPGCGTWCFGRPARRSSPGCARRCRSASS
jgi:ABC-type nitrate/sulfonate/bicarbonate transport system permease component